MRVLDFLLGSFLLVTAGCLPSGRGGREERGFDMMCGVQLGWGNLYFGSIFCNTLYL